MRLTCKTQYDFVFNRAKRMRGKYWQINARRTQNIIPRLGLAISKKVLARAIDRNLYKRIAREIFRTYKQHLLALDFVVMATEKHLNRQVLTRELKYLFSHFAK